MIKHIRITESNAELFAPCWELYNSAFPPEERRDIEYQKEIMQRREYNFDALFHNDKLVGFITWWNFDTVIYIEHFAIFESMRSGGYGKRVLGVLLKNSDKQILLEVEHPKDSTSERRIKFYENLGFKLNHHSYAQPPYVGTEFVELLIMTYPNAITQQELEEFKERYFPLIHPRNKL